MKPLNRLQAGWEDLRALGGVDAYALANWLCRYGTSSKALRVEVAHWVEWLSNTHPPWAAYRALMSSRLVAFDKEPGVRPLGIGETLRRVIAKCVLSLEGAKATTACGTANLCSGLSGGIEGAVHAITRCAREARGDPLPTSPPPSPTPPRPRRST